MKTQYFMPTPLQQRVSKQITDGNPRAFAIADLGQGPILTYRGHHVHLDLVSINLICGTQHVEISHLTQPPYIVLLAQNMRDQCVSLTLYCVDSMPVIEHSGIDGLRGQVFGYAQAVNGEASTLAHAIFQPECSDVFALVAHRSSLLMEQDPELCNHCTLCAVMIDELLQTKKGSEENEF